VTVVPKGSPLSSSPLRVLFWDIETAPLLAHVWSLWDKGGIPPARLLKDGFILSWSAKWRGERKVHSAVLTSEEAKSQDDSRIVQALADLLREADVIVAHNGDRFDLPKLNGRLMKHGLEPLGPVQTIDTLKLAKKNISLASNRLDYLGSVLGLGRKIDTTMALWGACYVGDPKALREMVRYNRQDVVLLEEVFEALRPYVRGLTRLVDGEGLGCPSCGSAELTKRGSYRTQSSTFQKFHCQKCGRYSRARKADPERFDVHPL
jgi:hypothetical protein